MCDGAQTMGVVLICMCVGVVLYKYYIDNNSPALAVNACTITCDLLAVAVYTLLTLGAHAQRGLL